MSSRISEGNRSKSHLLENESEQNLLGKKKENTAIKFNLKVWKWIITVLSCIFYFSTLQFTKGCKLCHQDILSSLCFFVI